MTTDSSLRNRAGDRLRRVADVIGSFGLLSDWRSRARLARIKLDNRLPGRMRLPREPIPLRATELGGRELWVRPGSTDPEALIWDYAYGIHRPPDEIAGEDLEGIVELGCNAGAGIASFAARYDHARVLGVEPDRENVALARRNVREFGERCQVIHAAVWDSATEIVIGGSAESDISARPARDDDPPDARMQAVTVDELLDAQMPGAVDYMHLSMEGGEPRALAGAPRWPQRVRTIRVEVQPEQGFPLEQALEMVRALGYRTRVTWVLNTPCVLGLRV